MYFSDTLSVVTDEFRRKEILIPDDWLESGDSLQIRFEAFGFRDQFSDIENGYAAMSVDNVSTQLISSNKSRKESSDDFIIYPNPVKSTLYLQTDNYVMVQIFNHHGKMILTSYHNPINVDNLKPGIYYLNVFDGEKYSTTKFIKTGT